MPKKNSVPQKKAEASTQILALRRPARQPIVDNPAVAEVISPSGQAPAPETAIIPELSTENSNPDPLVDTFIEVIAPWGFKVKVKITGVCLAPGGDKWVSFNAVDAIPAGWSWLGGVKRLSF